VATKHKLGGNDSVGGLAWLLITSKLNYFKIMLPVEFKYK